MGEWMRRRGLNGPLFPWWYFVLLMLQVVGCFTLAVASIVKLLGYA